MLSKEVAWTLWGFFLAHAALYVFTNVGLLVLNLLTFSGELWFLYVLVVWGLLLAAHYYTNKLLVSGFFLKIRDKILDRLNK
ncbi:hypothetical protein NO2_0624 [Candidatus Termititenax persephonae]|uniref:2TM domain-containing protein n=1 Tax=Candidatus Termititenax persephonae TaxID=2218525 RepID=A0A388TG20_9BACT|nr:hypothetical protein NO2_0624 [Candidatus Termititenax persephonae]